MTCCIDTNSALSVALPKEQINRLPKLLTRFTTWWLVKRQHRTNKRDLKSLLSLDERMLKDIGITRGDVTWARGLPKSVDATVELEIIARRRKR